MGKNYGIPFSFKVWLISIHMIHPAPAGKQDLNLPLRERKKVRQ